MDTLQKSNNDVAPSGPVVLAILDGIGIGRHEAGDMVRQTATPTLDWLAQ